MSLQQRKNKLASLNIGTNSYVLKSAYFIGKSFNNVCNIVDITETELNLYFYNIGYDLKSEKILEKAHWEKCSEFLTLKYNEKMARSYQIHNSINLPIIRKYEGKFGFSKGKEGNYFRLFHGGHPKS